MSACQHQRWERVESVVDGEHLATICADCLDRLPLTYSGEVIPIYRLCRYEPVAYVPMA